MTALVGRTLLYNQPSAMSEQRKFAVDLVAKQSRC